MSDPWLNIGRFVFQPRPIWWMVIAVLMAAIGMIVVNRNDRRSGPKFLAGSLLAICGAVLFGLWLFGGLAQP